MRPRRTIHGVAVAALALTAAGVAGGSTPPAPDTGHATATIQLPRLTVTDPAGAVHVVDLGSLVGDAGTDAGSAAALDLGGTSLLGTALPGWHVDAGNGPVTGDHAIPLAAAGVTGGLDVFGYDVESSATSARSTLGALTGTVTATPVRADVDLGSHGIDAAVGPTISSGSVALTVSGVQVGLGDLLPSDVLAALPLSGLVDLVSSLGLTLPAGADTVVAQLAALTTQLQDITDTAGQLSAAQASLGALLAALPGTAAAQQDLVDAQTQLATDLASLTAAQQQLGTDTATAQSLAGQVATLQDAVDAAQQNLDAANATVAALNAQIASLNAQLANPLLTPAQIASLTSQLLTAQQDLAVAQADVTSAQAALSAAQAALAPVQQQLDQANATVAADQALVTTLQQQVSNDQAAVTTAQQTLDALVAAINNDQSVIDAQALVTQLTTTLTGLVGQFDTAVGALPDLVQLRGQLIDALTAAPLLDVGTLGVTLSASADDAGGSGNVTCTVTGASVLGQPIPVGPCSALVASFAQIQSALAAALADLPLAGAVSPTLDGLASSTTGAPAAAADTTTNATAALTALHVGLPQATLAALADATVGALSSAVGTSQTALAGLGLPTVTATLTGSLGTLSTSLAALPTGGALAGLRTVGLDVSLAGLTGTGLHHRMLPAVVGGSGTGAPGRSDGGGTGAGTGGSDSGGGARDPGAAAGSVQPVQPPTPVHGPRSRMPEHAPALPFTGDNLAVDLAAGLVVLLAGAHLAATSRRRAPF